MCTRLSIVTTFNFQRNMHLGTFQTAFVLTVLATTVYSIGLDPWDDVDVHDENPEKLEPWNSPNTVKPVLKKTPRNPDSTTSSKSEGDYFFKRLLKLLTLEKIQDTDDETIEAGIDFIFSASDYNLIKEYISSPDELTPVQYRRVDGLLSDSISKESYIRKNIIFYLQKYCAYILAALVAVWCLYLIYHTNWSTFFSMRKLLLIFFLIVYGWETMIAIKEVEMKYYEELLDSIKPCSWLIWNVECEPLLIAVSHYLYYMHPFKILANMTSRLINSHLSNLVPGILSITRHLSDQLPYGVRTPVNITLNVFLLYMLLAISIALIKSFVFNRPVSVKFLFFELDFKQKIKDSHNQEHASSSRQNQSETVNSLSGNNLNTFLNLMMKAKGPGKKKIHRPKKIGM